LVGEKSTNHTISKGSRTRCRYSSYKWDCQY